MNAQIVNSLQNEIDETPAFKMNSLWVQIIAFMTVLVCLFVTFFGISLIDYSSVYIFMRGTVELISMTVLEVWNYY